MRQTPEQNRRSQYENNWHLRVGKNTCARDGCTRRCTGVHCMVCYAYHVKEVSKLPEYKKYMAGHKAYLAGMTADHMIGGRKPGRGRW